MSLKDYYFEPSEGLRSVQSFRNSADAINYAKEVFDEVDSVIIERKAIERYEIGTLKNGVFTAAEQKPTIEDTLLDAASKALEMIRYIIDDGYSYDGGSDIASKLTSAITKAKGGAK